MTQSNGDRMISASEIRVASGLIELSGELVAEAVRGHDGDRPIWLVVNMHENPLFVRPDAIVIDDQ